MAITLDQQAFSLPKLWPSTLPATVVILDPYNTNGHNGSVSFYPRAVTTPAEMTFQQVGDTYYDLAWAKELPQINKIDISFTPSALMLLGFNVYTISKANNANPGSTNPSIAPIAYNGNNIVTINFPATNDDTLLEIFIDNQTIIETTRLTVNYIKFYYPNTAIITDGYGGSGGYLGSVTGVTTGNGGTVPLPAGRCAKAMYPPDQAGYGFAHRQETKSIDLEGGQSRYRRDFVGARSIINAQWTLKKSEFLYLTSLFKNAGNKTVNLPLYLDTVNSLSNLDVHLVPGTLKVTSTDSLNFVVACQLDVKPLAFSTAWPADL